MAVAAAATAADTAESQLHDMIQSESNSEVSDVFTCQTYFLFTVLHVYMMIIAVCVVVVPGFWIGCLFACLQASRDREEEEERMRNRRARLLLSTPSDGGADDFLSTASRWGSTSSLYSAFRNLFEN